MKIVLSLDNLPFREEFEQTVKSYPCKIQGNILRMTANVVQCMEMVSIVNLYKLSEEAPDWGGGEKSEEVALPR